MRDDGTVKVLDFGLAKALDQDPRTSGPQDLVNSPTITSPAVTQAGIILGTAAYMSPEQAKGRVADRRSDIWAFGCVLFEMLSGKLAFAGEDISDTLANILKGEPDWASVPAGTPSSVVTLLRRCLDRDMRRRISAASTLRLVLDEPALIGAALAEARTDPSAVQDQIGAAVAAARRRDLWRALAITAVVAAVTGATAIALWKPLARTGQSPVLKFAVVLPVNPIATTGRGALALSRDGSQLAYLATGGRLLLRPLADFDSREVPTGLQPGEQWNQIVFSPDGQSIGFYSAGEQVVRRVPVAGGASLKVCPVRPPLGMTWDASGILVGQGVFGVLRCPSNGAAPEQLLSVSDGEEAHGPQLLPDGKTLLLTIARTSDGPSRWDLAHIVLYSLPSGPRRTLIQGGSDARYLPSGHLVYAIAGVLYAVGFDSARQELRGGRVPVVEGVRRSTGITGTAQFWTSDTGTLAYVVGPANVEGRQIGVAIADRAGTVSLLPLPNAAYSQVRVSPDGQWLAIATDDGKEGVIWTYRLGGAAPMRRITLEGRNAFAIWSPDGQRLAFQSDRGGAPGIYVQRADGSGVAQRLTTAGTGEVHIPESWSADGDHVLFSVLHGSRYSLSVLSLRDRSLAAIPGIESPEPLGAVFSPDGKWLAYVRSPGGAGTQSPNRGIFLQPFPPTGEVLQVPKQALDFHPVWSRDGRELVFVPSAASERMAVVPVSTRPSLTFGPAATIPQRVTGARLSSGYRAYDILPNGQFVGLVSSGNSGGTTPELRVVLNWFEELKQKVPLNQQ